MKKSEQQAVQAVAEVETSQQKGNKPVKEQPAGDKADISQTQLDDLQHDLELQMEISEKRLNEIQTVNQQNQELSSKVMELENMVTPPSNKFKRNSWLYLD